MTNNTDKPRSNRQYEYGYGYQKYVKPKAGWPKEKTCLGRVCGGAMRMAQSAGDRLCKSCKTAIEHSGGSDPSEDKYAGWQRVYR